MPRGLVAVLDYRQSYYASKEFNKFKSSDKERQLEDALFSVTDKLKAQDLNPFVHEGHKMIPRLR